MDFTALPQDVSNATSLIVSSAVEKSRSAFFSQLHNWPFGSVDVVGPKSRVDQACLLPAFEVYFNGCAGFPDANALITHGLATPLTVTIFSKEVMQSVNVIEPTDALKPFIDDMFDRYACEKWFKILISGILAYAARDGGQGVCATHAIAEYAVKSRDAELLDVLVDIQSRKHFMRLTASDPNRCYESERLDVYNGNLRLHSLSAAISPSGLEHRASAKVITTRQDEGETLIERLAKQKLGAGSRAFLTSIPKRLSKKQMNFVFEALGVSLREKVVAVEGGRFVWSTPSYTDGPPRRQKSPKNR